MPRSSTTMRKLTPRLKVWLEQGGEYAFGHGLCQILEAVAETGSIKHAATALGKSYRYVWGRIKKAERVLRFRLVATQVGGKDVQRSELTAAARELVDQFSNVRRRLLKLLETEFGRRREALRSAKHG
jgi:molybdate transport system regulatory protein